MVAAADIFEHQPAATERRGLRLLGSSRQEIGQNTGKQLDWIVAEPHYYYSFDCESKREPEG